MLADSKAFPLIKPNSSAKYSIICFPFAGGSAAFYYDWQIYFASIDINFYAVELPGRATRISESCSISFRDAVTDVADQIYRLIKAPFTCMGHSLGALMAYECCRILKKKYDLSAGALIVSGQRAPHLKEKILLPKFDNQLYDYLISYLRSIGAIDPELLMEKDFLAYYLPILESDIHLFNNHPVVLQPEILEVPIWALYGKDDESCKKEDVALWSDYTCREFNLHEFEGDHFFINPAKEKILKLLSCIIDQLIETKKIR